jgi:TldD protein
VGNGWGYGATNLLDAGSVAEAARGGVLAARSTDGDQPDIHIPQRVEGTYRTPMDEDPFEIPLEEKVELVAAAHRRLLSIEGVSAARGGYLGHLQETTFLASNGSYIEQGITLCGGGIKAIAEGDGDIQVRSAPKSFEGNVLQGGFEKLRAMNLVEEAGRVGHEAVALLSADPTPEGETTVILDGAQLSLQIHESVGHPTELDRVLGEEISLAGASFLLPGAVDELQYGSEHVTLTADATTPEGPGTFGFDDEGTPATCSTLVDRGRFKGFLSGRDSAARIGHESASALRSESWSRPPIVRMINVNLAPGVGSTKELIGGVEDGLMLSVNKSWSIDDLRLNFQFSCEAAYEIKGGRLTGRLLKNPVYYGVTPRFWGSCTGVAGPEAWQMWGWLFCGKGDPGQIMYVGHGCAPARFEGIRVGHT